MSGTYTTDTTDTFFYENNSDTAADDECVRGAISKSVKQDVWLARKRDNPDGTDVSDAMAAVVHQKTAVKRQWTAMRLGMKSAVNVTQQIKRLRTGKLKLPKDVKQWLSTIAP